MEDNVFDARISVPAGFLINGPPLAGKSTFVLNLLENADRLLSHPFDYVIWFYGTRNKTVEYLETQHGDLVTTVQGLPNDVEDYIRSDGSYGCHVYDDLMQSVSNSKDITRLSTTMCQHKCISWILIMQNLFYRGSERVTLIRSAHYLVLYKSPLDRTIAHYMAAKIMPYNRKKFMDIFERATDRPNGYLFIDGAQRTPEKARLRTDIFGDHQLTFS